MSQIKLLHSGGNGVILAAPSSNPASDRTLTLPGDADGTILTSNSSTGKILQVVSVTKSDTFSLTSTTAFTDVTGLSVAITPASTSNKILVAYDLGWSSSNGHMSCRIMRDSTAIKIGDAGGSNRQRVTGHYHHSANGQNEYDITQIAGTFLDSPNTTSSVTYKWQVGTPFSSGYTVFVNRTGDDGDQAYNGRSASSITVMEVSA